MHRPRPYGRGTKEGGPFRPWTVIEAWAGHLGRRSCGRGRCDHGSDAPATADRTHGNISGKRDPRCASWADRRADRDPAGRQGTLRASRTLGGPGENPDLPGDPRPHQIRVSDGGGGIRTLGRRCRRQRFSRPPHSTALPPLRVRPLMLGTPPAGDPAGVGADGGGTGRRRSGGWQGSRLAGSGEVAERLKALAC